MIAKCEYKLLFVSFITQLHFRCYDIGGSDIGGFFKKDIGGPDIGGQVTLEAPDIGGLQLKNN